MKDRIKQLRKERNLTQEEFAKQINISRSNLGNIEIGRISVTDRVVDDICSTFNISRDWLRTGSGEPLVEPANFSLDEYAKTQDLKETEINLIRGFMELDPNVRSALFNMFKNAFSNEPTNSTNSLYEESPKMPEELEKLYPPMSIQEKDSKVR